jgi:hypothetical protein
MSMFDLKWWMATPFCYADLWKHPNCRRNRFALLQSSLIDHCGWLEIRHSIAQRNFLAKPADLVPAGAVPRALDYSERSARAPKRLGHLQSPEAQEWKQRPGLVPEWRALLARWLDLFAAMARQRIA